MHSTAKGGTPSERGEASGRRPVTAAPGPRRVPQPRRRPSRPGAPAPLPARLGGGAHSSSNSSNSGGGGDSSWAPGRSGLRAFQRVWTSMPAGRGAGRAGTLGGAGLGPGGGLGGAVKTSGSHGEQAPARSLCGSGSPAGVCGRTGPRAGGLDLGPRGGRTPFGSLALASSNSSDSRSSPLAAAAPRDPFSVGAPLE